MAKKIESRPASTKDPTSTDHSCLVGRDPVLPQNSFSYRRTRKDGKRDRKI